MRPVSHILVALLVAVLCRGIACAAPDNRSASAPTGAGIDSDTLDRWSAKFRHWHYWPDHVVPADPKIEVCCGIRIEQITGDDHVKELGLLNLSTDEKTKLPVSAILIRIGLQPNTGYLKGLLFLDSEGFVLVNERFETSVPGIFAAGDIRHASARQIATAVGDGVTAVLAAGRFVESK